MGEENGMTIESLNQDSLTELEWFSDVSTKEENIFYSYILRAMLDLFRRRFILQVYVTVINVFVVPCNHILTTAIT